LQNHSSQATKHILPINASRHEFVEFIELINGYYLTEAETYQSAALVFIRNISISRLSMSRLSLLNPKLNRNIGLFMYNISVSLYIMAIKFLLL